MGGVSKSLSGYNATLDESNALQAPAPFIQSPLSGGVAQIFGEGFPFETGARLRILIVDPATGASCEASDPAVTRSTELEIRFTVPALDTCNANKTSSGLPSPTPSRSIARKASRSLLAIPTSGPFAAGTSTGYSIRVISLTDAFPPITLTNALVWTGASAPAAAVVPYAWPHISGALPSSPSALGALLGALAAATCTAALLAGLPLHH
eukprot:tig00020849_g14672.t1